jgi:hypothetical protein
MGKYHCTVDLLFDWFGLVCFVNKTQFIPSHTANSKPVKQEVNGTGILPTLVFPALTLAGEAMILPFNFKVESKGDSLITQ